jgi:serine/threonine-protein kinase
MKALSQCHRRARDCVIPVWFRNACGALADGPNGYGSAWGASRSLVENYALQGCRRRSGGCAIMRWVCTALGPADADGGSSQMK